MANAVLWRWQDRQLLLDNKKTKIAGILNVTPDSFSDGGKFLDIDKAVMRGCQMELEGANVIDIGGQSTRPGYAKVSASEEINRVVPVLEELKTRVKIPISVDTDKPEVAEAVLAAGAHIINDESGGNKEMAKVIAKYQAPVILMHWPKDKQEYTQVAQDVTKSLQKSVSLYERTGIKPEYIMIDPGLGFAKNQEENIKILSHLEQLYSLDKPIFVGASRKSFVGKITGVGEPDKRLAGSLAIAVWCAIKQIEMIRVHDVQETAQALAMVQALLES